MRRLILGSVLAATALAASGCGTAQHSTAAGQTSRRLGGMHVLPKWLTDTIGRENKLFHARLAHGYPGNGLSVRHSNGALVVGLWGKFTSPACRRSPFCPMPLPGNFLRLVISPRTHQVERVALTQKIDPIAAARRSDPSLDIFPDHPGRIACRIPRGGAVVAGRTAPTFAGRCETEYATATRQSAAAHAVRILFGERWSMGDSTQHAAWILTVRYRDGKILDTRIKGQPPQLWK